MKAVCEVLVGAWWSFVSGLALMSLGLVMIAAGSTPEDATSTVIAMVAVVIGIVGLGIAAAQGKAGRKSEEQRAQILERMDTIVDLLCNIRDRGQPPQSP